MGEETMKKLFPILLVVAAFLVVPACGGGGGGGGGGGPELTSNYVFESYDTPLGIPDYNFSGVWSEINVSGFAGSIAKVTVQVNISHTWLEDLTLYLFSPTGTGIILAYYVGLDGNNFNGTIFNDAATTPIVNGSAPFKGVYIPDEPLWTFNGENPAGTWYLVVVDDIPEDVGTLNWWKLGLD